MMALAETLSRVITSCGGMSTAMMRSETRFCAAKPAGRKISPGPLVPQNRPRKKVTPRSYWRTTRRLTNEYRTATASSGSRSSMVRSSGGVGFDDDRRALPAADAGGAQAVPSAAPAERVQQVRGDPRAARAERMAQRDGAAVHIGALAVEHELPLDHQVLGREGLVDLDQIHVIQSETRVGQCPPGGRHRADAHDGRVHAGHPPANQPA